jgi:death-on-curing protein
MHFLTFEEVLEIHNCLVADFADFADSVDPISPSGLRDNGDLLMSAVSRQDVGLGSTLKYPTPEGNTATLCYGVCNNHGFHNGNKRTALVALLCHLDGNGLTFSENVTHNDLYELMLRIASHELVRGPKRKTAFRDVDAEVAVLGEWIRKRTRKVTNGERIITYRELRQILRTYGFEFDNLNKNFIDIVKNVEVEQGFIFKKKLIERQRFSHIAYPRDGAVVGKQVIRKIRQDCGLTEQDGYDSNIFYNGRTEIDVFITRYRKTLRRLAKGGCKKFCVNGFLAGNCRLAWSRDDRRNETLTHRPD